MEINIDSKRYLLQINRIKLQDYIQCGLILPDNYLDENKETDIQSKNPNFLIIANGYFKELNEYQILLELILTQEEIEKLHKIEDVYYFDSPLPITRIKKVYVQDREIIKHMTVQIQNGENGFLPKKLFYTYLKNKKPIFELIKYQTPTDNISKLNYEDKIRIFDKRMGMFSFMKNSEFYYCDDTNQIANYSNHYFSTFSKLLREPLENNYFKELNILATNEEFKNLIYSNNPIDKDFILKESEKIKDNEIKEIFLQMTSITGTRKALNVLLEKNAIEYYIIGLIYYFRQKDSNKKDNFKIDIKSLIPYEVAEISLAILGIYLGYTLIRAEEKIDIKNKYFKKTFGDKFNMKFTLESKLDYVIIETIYNYCFNNKTKGYEYEYLYYPSKVKTISLSKDKIFYKIEKKNYFDVEYIKMKRNENKDTKSLFEKNEQ